MKRIKKGQGDQSTLNASSAPGADKKPEMESIASAHKRVDSNLSCVKSLNNNRLYLYLFHLFESVVSNVA